MTAAVSISYLLSLNPRTFGHADTIVALLTAAVELQRYSFRSIFVAMHQLILASKQVDNDWLIVYSRKCGSGKDNIRYIDGYIATTCQQILIRILVDCTVRLGLGLVYFDMYLQSFL